MPNPMESAATAQWGVIASIAGRAATYSRGATSISLTALPGSPDARGLPDEQFSVITRDRDWTIRASDISSIAPPQTGDRITADGHTYELIEPAYRISDGFEQRFRLFTRKL
jgi:hypothetical protein